MAGRGGAGNVLAAQQAAQRVKEDLEANTSTTSSEPAVAGPSAPRIGQQYAFSGRGGSGNTYDPRELHQKGTFQHIEPSDGATAGPDAAAGWASMLSGTQAKGSDVVRKVGRGGAGNAIYGITDDEREGLKKLREAQEGKRITASVEASVNAALAEPPKAKLSGPDP